MSLSALNEPRLRVPTIMLVAVAARLLTFGNPIVHVDEEFYYTVAKAMWSGAWPFIDLWDRKPVGLFLLYMPAAALPGTWGIVAYQAMAMAAVIATALVVARIADLAGWRRGATLAGIAYILWLDLLGGQGGQSPVFYNLPMAAAGLLVARRSVAGRDLIRRQLRARGIVAMALVGIALQIKYAAVFEGLFFGLWLLWREWRPAHRLLPTLAYGLTLIVVALLPTVLAALVYAHAGQWDTFFYANFESILARREIPFAELMENFLTLALILSPVVSMAFAAWARCDGEPAVRHFLLAWLIAALTGVLAFGAWFEHYGLPVLVPACACAAGFLGSGAWRGRAMPAILLTAALAGQITIIVDRYYERGTTAQFDALTRAIGRGPGCLYVYSGSTMLYPATGRCTLTRYIFPSHLQRLRENGAIGVDQMAEVRRILAARPAVIVARPFFDGESPGIRATLERSVRAGYDRPAMLPLGDEMIAVYRRRS